MNSTKLHIAVLALLAGSAACATAPPKELVDARAAYSHAANTRTQSLAPAQLDTAKNALAQAEQAFSDEPTAEGTRDLAYVAQRQAQLAETSAGMEEANKERIHAEGVATAANAQAARDVKQELKATKNQLAEAQNDASVERARQGTEKAQNALGEQKLATARAEEKTAIAEQATRDVMETLAKIATVKEEERGTVISLSGSVLFTTGQSALLPGARTRLDQVAEALKGHPRQMITIEGHTDSVGSAGMNQELSRARAQGVADYLISRGIPSAHVQASGRGSTQPVADNGTPDGRANNRRVEIILSRENKFAEQ